MRYLFRLIVVVMFLTVTLVVFGIPDKEKSETVVLTGELLINDRVLDVSGKIILDHGNIVFLNLTLSSASTVISQMQAYREERGLRINYAGEDYLAPLSLTSQWAKLFYLTEAGLRDSMVVKKISDKATSMWETVTLMQLRPGLPAKIRLGFGEKEDKRSSRLSSVVVYSLADWNNVFNANVVLRMNLTYGSTHEKE